MTTELSNGINNANIQSDAEIIDKLEKLPTDEKADILATLEMYSGPIPHPSILEAYQKLYPNAAEEIIKNGIEESNHRRYLENARQRRRGRLAWVVLIGVIVITMLFLFLSFELIMNNHEVIGSVFAGTTFLMFMGTMIEMVPKLSSKDDLSVDNSKEDK